MVHDNPISHNTLWQFNSSLLNMAIEIVHLPSHKIMIFHSQRVTIKNSWYRVGFQGLDSNNFIQIIRSRWRPSLESLLVNMCLV